MTSVPRSFNGPHVVACLLVAVTAVLLCFGALVTTYEAAMAVPEGLAARVATVMASRRVVGFKARLLGGWKNEA